MKIALLLEQLGSRLGLEGLRFTDEGLCRLVFDSNLVVDLERDEERGVYVYAAVCPLPIEKREQVYETLLIANMVGTTGSASFAIDMVAGEVLLRDYYPVHDADVLRFVEALEAFLNFLELWKGKLEALLACPAQQAACPTAHASVMRV